MSASRPSPLPESLELEGEPLERVHSYKNDWLSAVGRYRGASLDVILKVYRQRPLFGVLPVAWITRRMARREVELLRRFQEFDGVPRQFGTWNGTGLLHEFVEGHPLRRDEDVRPDFFELLRGLVGKIHEHGVAFVDLSKRDNVLVGPEGRPYLLDFQIAWAWPTDGIFGTVLPNFVGRAVLERLQRGDRHHVLKHQSRVQPDSLTQDELERLDNPGLLLRVHRKLLRPYQKWRRRRQRARA